MAAAETEKKSQYAPADRAAASYELEMLMVAYRGYAEGRDPAVAEEIKKRFGERVRELEEAVWVLEDIGNQVTEM
jgi:hypothetical protein